MWLVPSVSRMRSGARRSVRKSSGRSGGRIGRIGGEKWRFDKLVRVESLGGHLMRCCRDPETTDSPVLIPAGWLRFWSCFSSYLLSHLSDVVLIGCDFISNTLLPSIRGFDLLGYRLSVVVEIQWSSAVGAMGFSGQVTNFHPAMTPYDHNFSTTLSY